MSASNAKGILNGATRQLQARWEETRQSWTDHKADQFEHDYLDPLSRDVTAALRVIDELDLLLQQIHGDCE
jgi:hypothetical protein